MAKLDPELTFEIALLLALNAGNRAYAERDRAPALIGLGV
jgi:hypothetical protein